MAPPREAQWRFDATVENIGQIRHALTDFVGDALSDVRRADLAIIVTELATNAIVHGYRDGADGVVDVAVALGDRIEIFVRDYGTGMKPNPNSPGLGMGLAIVGQLADTIDVMSTEDMEGTTIRIEIS